MRTMFYHCLSVGSFNDANYVFFRYFQVCACLFTFFLVFSSIRCWESYLLLVEVTSFYRHRWRLVCVLFA